MKPFFSYYGTMWGRAQHYPPPQHDAVIEPFAGAAGYSLFYDCPRVDLFDADPIVCSVWRYLLAVQPSEIMSLPDMVEVGDNIDGYLLPQEAKWLIGYWLNPASAMPKKSRSARSRWGPDAKKRIASQLSQIDGWTITEGSYDQSPDKDATWLYDPPYQDKGKHYRRPFSDFGALADHIYSRRGSVIVCEQQGADWLPFRPLGSFKSMTKGTTNEVIFIRSDRPIVDTTDW